VTSETYGCTETAEINLQTIPSYELATTPSTSPIVNDFFRNDNSPIDTSTTNETYEFSLDGKNYQLSPFFTNLAVGNYTAFIRTLRLVLPVILFPSITRDFLHQMETDIMILED
jgi:hypothetical protein